MTKLQRLILILVTVFITVAAFITYFSFHNVRTQYMKNPDDESLAKKAKVLMIISLALMAALVIVTIITLKLS